MPMKRLPDPEPDFNSEGWHLDEFGSDTRPYSMSEETAQEREARILRRADEVRPRVALSPGQAETLRRHRG